VVARRGRVQGRVGTWPPEGRAAVGPPPLAWRGDIRDLIAALVARCRAWALAETAPGRLLPWLPVAFGLGIALYFTAEREPTSWMAGGCAALTALVAIMVRRRPVAFPVMLGIAALAAGFATATLKSARFEHPILQRTAYSVSLAGFVETREERERSDRIVVRVTRIDSTRSDGDLERVRLSVKKGMAPAVGSFVELKARLNPPLTPLRPGEYCVSRRFSVCFDFGVD